MEGATVLHPMAILGLLFAANASGQIINVSPQQVSLAAPAGATTPALQTFTISTVGSNLAFDASVRYLNPATAAWLSVTPMTGTTPATLTMFGDASKLTGGTYQAQVVISAGPQGLGAVVTVRFAVGSATGPGSVVVDTSLLTFVAISDLPYAPAQTLIVRGAIGKETAGFTAFATSSGNWLTVSPTTAATPGTLTVGVIPQGLSSGNYTGTVTLTPSDGSPPAVVPVTLAILDTSNAPAALTLLQTALTVNYQLGTSAPPVQSVGISVGSGTRQYQASTETSWLRLVSDLNPTPASSLTDTAPGEFRVAFDPTGLALGTYVGTVTVTASGLPPQQLPVTLNVSSQAALNANPSSIALSDISFSAAVIVTSTGSASLSFTAAVSQDTAWLHVTPTAGSTSGGSQLAVIGDPTGLNAGTYTGKITLTVQGSGATFNIPVQLTVSESSAASATLELSVFSAQLGGVVSGTNPSQTIDLSTSVTATTHNFTAAATSTGGWLTVSPFSGAAPAKLTLTANSAAVTGAGTYDGSVTVTSLLSGASTTIPVSFTLDEQTVVVDPLSLSFEQQQFGVAPPAQTIRVQANVPSTFKVTTPSKWIKVSPVTGSTPSTITVSVDPTGLAPGTNTGSIQIEGPKNVVTLEISLTVMEPPGPTASPATLTFAYQLGGPAPPAQTISVGSNIATAVGFTASATTESGANWLLINPKSGLTPAIVEASVNTAQVVPGRQAGAITIASVDGSVRRTVSVVLNVTATSLAVQALLHGATLAPTPVAPGQIVTLTGSGLGPATGVVATPTAAGAIESRLAGVRVLFDGVPAPLLYVRDDQINAIVPYAMYGRVSARVQVEGAAGLSVPIEAKVVDSAPGIFTSGPAGRGQTATLNADYSINSLANPAQRGSIVSVYGSGEGQTNPQGQDGRIILTDLRKPLLPVSATIGGRPAEVLYLGSAPSLVSGVFQANVRVPADVEPGSAPIEIQIGGVATQAGVTIAVR